MALSRIVVVAGLLGMIVGTAQAAEIVVICTTAPKEALIEIVPLYERASGHKVNISFGSGPVVLEKVRAGQTGDLFIGPDEFADPLAKEGKLLAGSRVEFAVSGASVAVRAGAPKPDVSTPDKFKAAVLAAKTVSYSAGASGLHIARMFERLGIAAEIKAKLVPPAQPGEPIGRVVARGDAEIGIQQLIELLPVAGIAILGPLPGDLQRNIPYGTSAMPGSKEREAAMSFVSFLRSGEAAAILKKKGMDPA
jgi:molybdate transport system substrate-binding protein